MLLQKHGDMDTSYRAVGGTWGVWTVNFTLDESGLLVVDPATLNLLMPKTQSGIAERLTWSPDGLFLAYFKRIGQNGQYTRELTVIDLLDGSEMIVFQDDQLDNSGLTWSPDALQIGFSVRRPVEGGNSYPTWDIARVIDWWDPVNRQVLLVTDTTGLKRETFPDWNPSWIAP